MTGTEVEPRARPRRRRAGALRGRARAERRAPPGRRPADGVRGRPRRRRAGPDRLRRAERRRGPDGRRRAARRGDARRRRAGEGQAARRRVRRDDPRRGRGRHRHRARRDHGARATGSRPGRRWRRCCRSPPTCSSWRSRPTGRTAWASTASPARSTPRRARRWRRRRGATDPGTEGAVAGVRDRGRGPRPVPALHRAAVRGRHDRALAAVAEGAPDGGRASGRSTTSSTSPTS